MQNHVAPTWWDELLSYFTGYPVWLVEFSITAIIGFAVGFILRNFGKYIVFAVVTIVAAAYILDYFAFATFHIAHIKQVLGLTDPTMTDFSFKMVIAWGRANVPICAGAAIGFLFGWKIGH